MNHRWQHFVPQCYLRSFSTDANQRAIALYNGRRDIFAAKASIKDQCAKDFFYDKTGFMEDIFGGFEGKFAHIVRSLIRNENASAADLLFLRYFAYLQHLRTEAISKIKASVISDMRELLFSGDPEGLAWSEFDPSQIPRESIRDFFATLPYLSDLADGIFINNTCFPFICSDNPAVIYNRFHVQRRGRASGGAGLINSGVIILLPLTPRFAFVSYDKGIYAAQYDARGRLLLKRPRDVEALNALQIIRAAENVYLSDPARHDWIRELWRRYAARRPANWHKWNLAVEATEHPSDNARRFVGTQDLEHWKQSGGGLLLMQSVAVDPGVWCSILPIRSKPVYFDTKSAAGLVRSPALLDLRRRTADRREQRFQVPRPTGSTTSH